MAPAALSWQRGAEVQSWMEAGPWENGPWEGDGREESLCAQP